MHLFQLHSLLAYYWGEDKLSGGHLKGSRLKQMDLNRWMLAVEGGASQALNFHIAPKVQEVKCETEDDEDDEDD